jgi:hypothetical protein
MKDLNKIWASLVAILADALIGLLYRDHVEEQALTDALGQWHAREFIRASRRRAPPRDLPRDLPEQVRSRRAGVRA